MKGRILEAFFGYLILVILGLFVLYSMLVIVKGGLRTYTIKASFHNIGSLVEGSKVIINGVEVGKVTSIELLLEDYEVIVTMNISKNVKIPKDSAVSIVTSGFFDAPNIVINPSKNKDYMEKNGILKNTTDWVSLEDKIGSIFFNSGE